MRQPSPRQMDCMRLAAQGLTSVEIAAKLNLSKGTVDNYVAQAIRLVGAKRRIDACAELKARGLL